MTTRKADRPGTFDKRLLAGLSFVLSLLAHPAAAPARGGPAAFMDGVIMAWVMIGLTGLGLWLLICLCGLWLVLRGSETRGEKTFWCIAAAIVFVLLPLIDRMVLDGRLQQLFFSLPKPVLATLMCCLAVVYSVLALMALVGICWGLALILAFFFGRDGKRDAENEKQDECPRAPPPPPNPHDDADKAPSSARCTSA